LIDDPKAEKFPERGTVELVLEQLSAAQAMQVLLQRQNVAI
jgi:hypothetical protein